VLHALRHSYATTPQATSANPPSEGRFIGHGFRNLANYRLRLLLTAGLD